MPIFHKFIISNSKRGTENDPNMTEIDTKWSLKDILIIEQMNLERK